MQKFVSLVDFETFCKMSLFASIRFDAAENGALEVRGTPALAFAKNTILSGMQIWPYIGFILLTEVAWSGFLQVRAVYSWIPPTSVSVAFGWLVFHPALKLDDGGGSVIILFLLVSTQGCIWVVNVSSAPSFLDLSGGLVGGYIHQFVGPVQLYRSRFL